MWASQPKAHKAISPTLHTQPCYTSAFLGHLSWWVLLRTTVRSRCQARTRHFPPSLPEEGPGFRAPFPPTRAGGKKSIAAGLHYPQSTAMTFFFFFSPKVAGRGKGCILAFSARLELWPSGKMDMNRNLDEKTLVFPSLRAAVSARVDKDLISVLLCSSSLSMHNEKRQCVTLMECFDILTWTVICNELVKSWYHRGLLAGGGGVEFFSLIPTILHYQRIPFEPCARFDLREHISVYQRT